MNVPGGAGMVIILFARGPIKELQEIAAQMRETVARDLGAALRLGEHKGTLQHRLRIEGETLRAPLRFGRIKRFRGRDVLFNLGSVRADISVTCTTDRGVGVVSFLHHGAEEAGELGDRSGEDCRAEIDVAEQAIQGVCESAIGRAPEKLLGHLRKMRSCCDREIFLALEVMKERTLRKAGRAADVVHRARRVALRADHMHCRVEQASSRVRLLAGRRCIHEQYIPTGWYAVK